MKSKIQFLSSMMIFGTLGLFIKNITYTSSQIALFRGLIGSIFLFMIYLIKTKNKKSHQVSKEIMKHNGVILLLSSFALGANWIFLFEAFKNTTVSNATLSYYFAPVMVAILSPIILKEKLSVKKLICIIIAMIGMILIVGSQTNRNGLQYNILGILQGLVAAGFYASLMLLNKFLKKMDGLETTLIQLSVATLLLIPYVILTSPIKPGQFHISSIILMISVGFIHTGVAFFLFFSGMKGLKGQSIAVLSYLDPVTSLLLSFIILQEKMSLLQLCGSILLLGATLVSETNFKLIHQKEKAF